ncbi:MAG TPA: queuosine salvage family protein [Ktedonobacteraceae bacterium]|nr:queuosine salvage family protein [Ktedonobacteraceae bacterium]
MNAQWFDADDETDNVYHLINPDQLGVLTSTLPVVELGELVWINYERLNTLQIHLLDFSMRSNAPDTTAPDPTWHQQYHFFDGTERTANWLLLLDALNFCFWAEKDQPRWSIEYEGEVLNGYWALAASLTRAVQEGYPLWDAHYLSEMSSVDLAHIFRSVPPPEGTGALNLTSAPIPLFQQRLANAREAGSVLLERFDGQFTHAIEEAGGSAVRLALLLVEHFPSFHDVADFRKQEVRFFKRAQICVSDLHGAFGGKQWGAFTDLHQLTIFADYKLPQILRHFGVLEYHPALAERIDNFELLESGSDEEVEIRAAAVWACELLRQTMSAAGHGSLTAAEIDQRLWLLSHDIADMRPYHRTRTIYY